jgi:hypothetical protein
VHSPRGLDAANDYQQGQDNCDILIGFELSIALGDFSLPVPDVRIKLATVKAVYASLLVAVHAMPIMQDISYGSIPAKTMWVLFQPSTNSSAWRLSRRRSRNNHSIQLVWLVMRSGCS